MKAILFEKWESTLIAKTQFTPEDNELVIEFNNGKKYLYKNFTREDYDLFIAAESKGKHFLTHIRNKYKDTEDVIKLDEDEKN